MSTFAVVPHLRRSRTLRLLIALILSVSALIPIIESPQSAMAAGAYTTSSLNLRAGPSTGNYIKLTMPEGAWVELLSDLGKAGFYKVNYQGILGYAHGSYLSVNGGNVDDGSDPGWGNAGTAYTTSSLNLRAGPSTSHAIRLVMPLGAAVQLTGATSGGFSGVVYGSLNGWASNDYLTDSGGGGGEDPGNGNTGTAYTTSDLNLRSGPGTSNRILLVMPGGAEVTLTGEERNGFAGVRYNGTSGWASLDYLSTTPAGDDGDGSYTQDEIIQIIYAAADRYGQSRSAMLQVARCESVLDPYAVNPYSNASGLFQFLPGTWATTPFAAENIFDPVANANAAGWMWSVGRRGEWVC